MVVWHLLNLDIELISLVSTLQALQLPSCNEL